MENKEALQNLKLKKREKLKTPSECAGELSNEKKKFVYRKSESSIDEHKSSIKIRELKFEIKEF